MHTRWTLLAAITIAGVPAIAAAQQPAPRPDSARQGTATGRRVNQANESGDTTRSALRDSLLRSSTGATREAAQPAAPPSGQQPAQRRAGQATVVDSAQAVQGTATGRPVLQQNESGDTTRSALRDSLVRAATGTATETTRRTGAGGGRIRLSRSQVRQLQEALNSAGCDAGTADGVMGRRTRAAMACARQKHGVSENDDRALYQALGLSF